MYKVKKELPLDRRKRKQDNRARTTFEQAKALNSMRNLNVAARKNQIGPGLKTVVKLHEDMLKKFEKEKLRSKK